MSCVKVAFVGAGSYVFGPSMLSQTLKENRLDDVELALVDVNREAVETMAAIGRHLSEREGVKATITAHTDWKEALPGANYVICSAAVDMNRRFRIDRQIIDETYPGHLITEFGGVHGISYSLRQIALIRALAEDMKRLCRNAWLLDISNPLTRVCQAVQDTGIRTVGFCSVSVSGYGKLWSLFHGGHNEYPYTKSREIFEVRMGGTNHLSWLVELRDKQTGADMMTSLRNFLHNRGFPSKSEVLGRRTGFMPMSGDDHIQDFLPPEGLEHSLELSSHGSDEDRQAKLETMCRAAAGEVPFEEVEVMVSWERPLDLISAMVDGTPAEFESLSLANEGQIPQLPCGAFVETRCVADREGLRPDHLDLPASVLPYARNAVEVTGAIVRAAERRSREDLRLAVEMDPTILDKELGWAALERCLDAHRDLIGDFGA